MLEDVGLRHPARKSARKRTLEVVFRLAAGASPIFFVAKAEHGVCAATPIKFVA